MKYKKIFISELNDTEEMSLAEWKIHIDSLISNYGEDSILSADAGYNNIMFYLTTENKKFKKR